MRLTSKVSGLIAQLIDSLTKCSIALRNRSRVKWGSRWRFVGPIELLEPRFALASITATATESTIYEGGIASYLLQSAPTKAADTFVSYTISNPDSHTILGVRFKIHGEADAYSLDYYWSNLGYQKVNAKLVQGSIADWANGFDLTASQDESVPNSPDEFDLEDESIDVELILDYTEETWEDYWNYGGTVQQATSTVTINIKDNDTRIANMFLRPVDGSAAEPGFGLSTGQVTTVENPNKGSFELVVPEEWRGGGIDLRAMGTAAPGVDYTLALINPPEGAWLDVLSYYQPDSNDPSAINHGNYRVHVPTREGLGSLALKLELTPLVDSNFHEGEEIAEFAFASPSVPLISYVATVYSGDPTQGYADVYFDEVRIIKQGPSATVSIEDAILASVDIDTDSNNNGPVERTNEEDAIEDIAGQGKKLYIKAPLASTVVLDADTMAAMAVDDNFSLKLIVSPGLNVWADQEKTMRLTSPDFETIPEDDTLGETYIWSTAWAGTLVVFVEGSTLGNDKTMQWQLQTSIGTTVARDTVRFEVIKQNKIFVGIDGTGTSSWLYEGHPNAKAPDNPARWNSHTRNLVDEQSKIVEYTKYKHGPDDFEYGTDSTVIFTEVRDFIRAKFNESGGTAEIAIVGWSRGAAIALWVANDLSTRGIGVGYVGLFDPVDMSDTIPDYTFRQVQPNVGQVTIVGPTIDAPNLDWLIFERLAWNEVGAGFNEPYIRNAFGNDNTFISLSLLNASHGAIGGVPGYNDQTGYQGYVAWSEVFNTDYSYPVDRHNSIVSDQIVRSGLRSRGWQVAVIADLEYGFPVANPTFTPVNGWGT